MQRGKESFEPSLIQDLTRLDDRMRAADHVLSGHIAPSIFFHVLEQLTLQTVSFNNLSFQVTDAQNMTIKMTGQAASVNSIALQADYLSKSGVIANPIFSNINRAGQGVQFDLAAIVNPNALKYRQGSPVPAEAQEIQTPTLTSPFGSGQEGESEEEPQQPAPPQQP